MCAMKSIGNLTEHETEITSDFEAININLHANNIIKQLVKHFCAFLRIPFLEWSRWFPNIWWFPLACFVKLFRFTEFLEKKERLRGGAKSTKNIVKSLFKGSFKSHVESFSTLKIFRWFRLCSHYCQMEKYFTTIHSQCTIEAGKLTQICTLFLHKLKTIRSLPALIQLRSVCMCTL